LEPVQASGGVMIAPDGYLQAVRALCDEFGILMIADEVICGFGRTGKMFGVEHWDVIPDFMSVAKGISSGYAQLGAVVVRQKVRDVLVQYDEVMCHGFTYSGHPMACAVALKNLEILENEKIVQNVEVMEKELLAGLKYLEDKHSIVPRTRAIGLLSAFELSADNENPFDTSIRAAQKVVEECFKRNLILRAIDFEPGMNIIPIAPPLVINKQEIAKIISIIDDSITSFKKKV
jgi:putrescine aminotransferase